MSPARIVVVSGVAPQTRAAFEAAARIAARLEGELAAVFVQELELLRWAALPFTREVAFPSASTRDLDADAMARAMRAAERRLQASVAAAAAGAGIPWSFRVARGTLAGELARAAADADLALSAPASADAAARRVTAVCRASIPADAIDALRELHALVPVELEVVVLGDDGEDAYGERLRRVAPGARVRRAPGDADLARLLEERRG